MMSERREDRRYDDSGCFDQRSLRLMKAMQGYHSYTAAQDLVVAGGEYSDLGTIQTAQEVKLG